MSKQKIDLRDHILIFIPLTLQTESVNFIRLLSQYWIQTGSTLDWHAEVCSTAAIAPEQGGL